MKTLTQVFLPIAAIAGLVYGITFVTNYSPRGAVDNSGKKSAQNRLDKLVFTRTAGGTEPIKMKLGLGTVESPWRSCYETLEHGHFDFWFQNSHDQDVHMRFNTGNCTCIGAELGVVPKDAWSTYVNQSVLSGLPGLPASPLLAAFNATELNSRITFNKLADRGTRAEGTVPAGSVDVPQIAILRSEFEIKTGKTDPTVRLTSAFFANLPNSPEVPLDFQVIYHIVPRFELTASEINLGDLYVGSKVSRGFICYSRTKKEMDLDISTSHDFGDFRDCIEWSKPEKLSREEIEILAEKLSKNARASPENAEANRIQARDILSAYKVRLDVVERRDVVKNGKTIHEQLDLGPLEFGLKISSSDDKSSVLKVAGVVRGDVRLVGDQGADRMDFGPSFASNQSKTKQITLISNRAGLDLELVKSECSPDYLESVLHVESEKDGCKKWILSVTIPEGRLYGALPNGHVVLRTKDATPRKFRIPVKASSFDR